MGRLLAIVVLLLLNGFFVAVELALPRARRMRLEAMTRTAGATARLALRATSDPGRMRSAGQPGITPASLPLGCVAERTPGALLEEWPPPRCRDRSSIARRAAREQRGQVRQLVRRCGHDGGGLGDVGRDGVVEGVDL